MHFNSAGIRYEQDNPVVMGSTEWENIAPSLRSALARFSFREANLREGRLSDWPSYRASGLRSVRQFQHEYLCIWVIAINDAELFYDAYCHPRGEADIALHVTLNPKGTDEEMSRILGRLFRACLHWPAVMSE